ncbi:MAG TPA: response regulator [Pirellulales bacterium]|nr:response regulator [Pirellulales bacterium]
MPRQLLEHLNHELRSPMTVIVGMTDLLLLAPLDDEQKRSLQSVRQASDGLLLLLDELVDFSRLEARSLKLSRADFSLAELAEQARAIVRRSAGTQVPFSLAIGDEVPQRMTGDPERLAQVIAGLVRSTAKLRSARPLTLKVAAESVGEHRVLLHFAFGSAEAEFDAGEDLTDEPGESLTLESFRQSGYRGAGLSLPVAAALVALMDGQLWMVNDPARPVVFRFSCFVDPTSTAAKSDLASAIERQFDIDSNGSWHVLLAEDTRANQHFFRTVLEDRGHTVVVAANGQEAIETFASRSGQRPFDVVLLDLEMPVMDGRQAAAALRQSAAFAARPTPVVALTAHRGDAACAASGRFDAVITKPCNLDDFFRILHSAVRGVPRSVSQEPTGAPSETVVDYHTALTRLGGNEQLFRELAAFFLDDAPVILKDLGEALGTGNAAGVERAAHSLRGLAANFGAPAAVQVAGELQDVARRGDLSQGKSLHDRLAREIGRLADELRASPLGV